MARRQFLAQLEAPLRAKAPQCSFRYRTDKPFSGEALEVRVPGKKGLVRVRAFYIHRNVQLFDRFPAEGQPHWQISLRMLGGPIEDLISCDVESIVGAFGAWLAPAPTNLELRGRVVDRSHLSNLASQSPPHFAPQRGRPALVARLEP